MLTASTVTVSAVRATVEPCCVKGFRSGVLVFTSGDSGILVLLCGCAAGKDFCAGCGPVCTGLSERVGCGASDRVVAGLCFV